MSFGTSGGGSSSSQPEAKWFPGQQEYIPEFMKPFQEMYTGGMGSNLGQMLSSLALQSGTGKAEQEGAKIASARGMSAPAKAKALRTSSEAAVTGAAGAPISAWSEALNTLRAYALQTPVVGQISSGSQGGGMSAGCCFIFLEGEGQITQTVRVFRDSHYLPGSLVDLGYRWMAGWLVPLMQEHPPIKQVIRTIMTKPLSGYTIAFYDGKQPSFTDWMARVVWPTIWRVVGLGVKYAST